MEGQEEREFDFNLQSNKGEAINGRLKKSIEIQVEFINQIS